MRRCRGAALAALAALLLGVAADTDGVQQKPWAETTEGTGLNLTCLHPKNYCRLYPLLCALGAGTCFLSLPHSANTQLALAMHLACLILTVFLGQLLGITGQLTVTQEDGPVMVKQGHTFQTTCKYQTSNFDGLFWYQQRKGQAPQLVSYQAGPGSKRNGRITTHLNTTGKSSVLRVEEVQGSDTAFRFRQLCSLGAGTCFLSLPHSANTQLALAMHLACLILTVFLGQLLVFTCGAADIEFLPGTTEQVTVTQEDGPVMVKQGHPFQTTCKYQTSSFLWLALV
ncbi:hypothetical protein DUI87_21983 [Hirundo rustica rustica]|uniref:Immunoglobulin V-set domain-containing protein n=1 Tax=Hirundo rustica rustica TaxID=333673 RepID=A0A3M0JKA8_HIRRU|nr:hypothetical protein DUI87_21983 [Hirundo rustica rustica]